MMPEARSFVSRHRKGLQLQLFCFGNFILAARPFETSPAESFGQRLVRSVAPTENREFFINIDNVLFCYKLKAMDRYNNILKH